MRYKAGIDREQISLEPLCFDALISEDNTVRAIDAITNRFDMNELGFVYGETKSTGRKPYNPSDMLKLYLYGYFNGIRSSRKLERECSRNVELMWLMNCLKPDFKTIADFRKNNQEPLQKVFLKFSLMCDELGLLGKELVAIDGSKFRASNNSNAYWTNKKIVKKRKQYAEFAEKYTKLLEACDNEEEGSHKLKGYTRKDLEQRLEGIQAKIDKLDELAPICEETDAISLTDADARVMRHSNGAYEISHNVQIAVDDKNHMVVAVDVTSSPVDYQQLYPMAKQAKENMGADELTVLADKGYYSAKHFSKAEEDGINAIVSKPERSHVPDIDYSSDNFIYDEENDVYICPQGGLLTRSVKKKGSNAPPRYIGRKALCRNCPVRDKCFNGDVREIKRDENKAAAERAVLKTYEYRELYKKRKTIVEHIFGTVKASFGFRYLPVRRTGMVKTEASLYFLAYNLKRAVNTVGVGAFMGV
jgi:transposase